MTKFTLKFEDEDITILQNKKPIGETSDLEEAFAYIATTIKDERISNYKVVALDEGQEEVLDFDYKEILKNSKKYNFDDEETTSKSSRFEDEDIRSNRRRSRGFNYTSTTTPKDYENLSFALRDAITPGRIIRDLD